MSSTNALVEVLEEYHYLAEPFDRGQLKEMASAVPPKDCRADEEFRESLTSRQREVLDEVQELVRDRIGRRARQESVKDVVGMQVDVSAQYRVTCDSYKEMLGELCWKVFLSEFRKKKSSEKTLFKEITSWQLHLKNWHQTRERHQQASNKLSELSSSDEIFC